MAQTVRNNSSISFSCVASLWTSHPYFLPALESPIQPISSLHLTSPPPPPPAPPPLSPPPHPPPPPPPSLPPHPLHTSPSIYPPSVLHSTSLSFRCRNSQCCDLTGVSSNSFELVRRWEEGGKVGERGKEERRRRRSLRYYSNNGRLCS